MFWSDFAVDAFIAVGLISVCGLAIGLVARFVRA